MSYDPAELMWRLLVPELMALCGDGDNGEGQGVG
jgi:hypothetical protein